jgi:hypothetical protein
MHRSSDSKQSKSRLLRHRRLDAARFSEMLVVSGFSVKLQECDAVPLVSYISETFAASICSV